MREKILAIIPARSGSKGVKDKNIKPFLGLPLMAHTILSAQKSRICDEILLATDSREYAQIAKSFGASVPYLRSEQTSSDSAKSIDVILEALAFYQHQSYDTLIFLQPTSPLRDSEDILGAYALFKASQGDVASISPAHFKPTLLREYDPASKQLKRYIQADSSLRRQDMPCYYQVNGAIYINAIKNLHQNSSLNDNPIGYVMSAEKGIDIDSELDFLLAGALALKS